MSKKIIKNKIINPETVKVNKMFTITGVILVLFVVAAIWNIPRPEVDLSISLAAGQDVMAGRLNAPDDWSFSTNGKIWINQNWGAGVILYLVQDFFGDTGLLVLKIILILLCSLFLILVLQKLKVPLAISTLVSATIMISINIFATLRPNLFTLTFTPLLLWLLYESDDSPHMIWAAVLINVLWANIHGGFIFGTGMICLWVICIIVPEAIKQKWNVIKNRWQLIAGCTTAILLSGLLNPFGFKNLTFPFMMVKGDVWHGIIEWRPMWEKAVLSKFTIYNFIIIICIIVFFLGLRGASAVFNYFRAKQKKNSQIKLIQDGIDIRIIIFETAIALISIIMAVLSNRFLTIALIMVAPLIARQVWWFVRSIRLYWIPLSVMYCIIFIYGILIIGNNTGIYNPNNPVRNTGRGSLFEKMHYLNFSYNPELVRFINTNQISGNVLSPWEWEGYLRLHCPQLKMFIGGRAQQVYSENTYIQYLFMTSDAVKQYYGKTEEDLLNSINADFIISGNTEKSDKIIVTALKSKNWVIVYADEYNLLFANTQFPAAAKIAEQLHNNQLIFETLSTEALSKAAFVLSQYEKWDTQKIIEVFSKAFDIVPTWLWGYQALVEHSGVERNPDRNFFIQIAMLLDEQLMGLEKMRLDGPDAQYILFCRIYNSYVLYNLAMQSNMTEKAAQENKSYTNARNLLPKLIKKWELLVPYYY